MMSEELAHLTWPEAAERLRQRPIGLLPIGAIEAHGPHLPLDTDVLIAQAMARRAGHRFSADRIPTLVLPPLHYGVSFVGTSFPGTSPADAPAFEAQLTSVLVHLLPQGYRAICICNAHLEPAHVDAIVAVAETATETTGVPAIVPDIRQPRWAKRLSAEFRRGARHAGSYETSLVMAIDPERVRTTQMADLPPVWVDLPARLRAGARTFVEAGSPLGYFGDPTQASAAEGEQLLDALAEIVYNAVYEILRNRNQEDI